MAITGAKFGFYRSIGFQPADAGKTASSAEASIAHKTLPSANYVLQCDSNRILRPCLRDINIHQKGD